MSDKKRNIEEAEFELAKADAILEKVLDDGWKPPKIEIIKVEGKPDKDDCKKGHHIAQSPPGFMYVHAMWRFIQGYIRWEDCDFVGMLLSDKYTPDKTNDEFLSEVAQFELEAEGYERLKLEGAKHWDVEPAAVVATIDGWNAWGELMFDKERAGHIIVFRDTGDPSTSNLVSCYILSQYKHVCGITMPNPLLRISVL